MAVHGPKCGVRAKASARGEEIRDHGFLIKSGQIQRRTQGHFRRSGSLASCKTVVCPLYSPRPPVSAAGRSLATGGNQENPGKVARQSGSFCSATEYQRIDGAEVGDWSEAANRDSAQTAPLGEIGRNRGQTTISYSSQSKSNYALDPTSAALGRGFTAPWVPKPWSENHLAGLPPP